MSTLNDNRRWRRWRRRLQSIYFSRLFREEFLEPEFSFHRKKNLEQEINFCSETCSLTFSLSRTFAFSLSRSLSGCFCMKHLPLSLSLSRPFCVSVYTFLYHVWHILPLSLSHPAISSFQILSLANSDTLKCSLSLSLSLLLSLSYSHTLSLSLSSTHSHVSTRDEWKKGLQTKKERTNAHRSLLWVGSLPWSLFFGFFSFQASADDKEKKVWCHEKIKKLDKIEIRDEFGQVCEKKKVWYKNLNIDFLHYLSTRSCDSRDKMFNLECYCNWINVLLVINRG